MKRFFSLLVILTVWDLPALLGQEVYFPVGAFPVCSVVRSASNEGLVVARNENALYVVNLSEATPSTTKIALDQDANGMPFQDAQGMTIPVATPTAVAVNEVTQRAVVTNFGSDNISIVNLEARTTEAVVPVGSPGGGPRSVAIDTKNNIAIVAHMNGNNVTLVDLNTNTPVLGAPIDVGANPISVVYDEINELALVATFGNGKVSVIDYDVQLKVGTAVNSINVGSGPLEIALHPGSRRAFVVLSNGRSIAVLDTSKRPIGMIDLVGLNDQGASVAINTKTNFAAVLLKNSKAFSLIDIADNKKITTQSPPIGDNPTHLAVNPNNNTLLVTNPVSDSLQIVPMGFLNYFPLVMDTSQFRTNLGIRNLGENKATVVISWGDKNGVFTNERSIEVGPNGFTQVNNVLQFLTGSSSGTNISGSLRLASNLPINSFISIIDNNTQDPALQVGASRGAPQLLLSSSTNVGVFSTKLVILNLGSINAVASVRARDNITGEQIGQVTGLQIPPNGFLQIDDIIGDLGLGNSFGSLEIYSQTVQPILCVALITSTEGTGGFLVAAPVDLPLAEFGGL